MSRLRKPSDTTSQNSITITRPLTHPNHRAPLSDFKRFQEEFLRLRLRGYDRVTAWHLAEKSEGVS